MPIISADSARVETDERLRWCDVAFGRPTKDGGRESDEDIEERSIDRKPVLIDRELEDDETEPCRDCGCPNDGAGERGGVGAICIFVRRN